MANDKNIKQFFQGRKYSTDWCQFPIVLRWLKKKSMESSVKVIDDKVAYLLSQSGGISKLKEWFLSDDRHLVTTTAERYILDHIRSLNPAMKEIFVGNDVDASIEISGQEYGLEVTCFLDTMAEWIIVERVQQYIDQNGIIPTADVQISADLLTLKNFSYFKKSEQCDIIEQLASHIGKANAFTYKGFSIQEIFHLNVGSISWVFEQDKSDPFYDLLNDLSNKIYSKNSQLSKRSDNVLFISMGSMPTNWLFPSLFAEMRNPSRWKAEVIELETKVLNLINGTAVKGVCFFVYSLDKQSPFYPLKIITTDQNLTLNL